jgi:hypothetical protein
MVLATATVGRAQVAAPDTTLPAARLRGVVQVAGTDAVIPNAQVVLIGLDQVVNTNYAGKFDFGPLPPATYFVQARALGYTPYTIQANLAAASSLEFTFRLKKGAVQLEDLQAKAVERKSAFAERMLSPNGFGYYVTAADIERRKIQSTCEIFATIAGVRVTNGGGTGSCAVRVIRAQGLSIGNADCGPAIFLNGSRSDIDLIDSGIIPVTDIEGIEVYKGNGSTPAEFTGPGSTCGVIAIWTK